MKLKEELEKEESVGKFLLGAFIGGVIGAVGIAAYIKHRDEENKDKAMGLDAYDEFEEEDSFEKKDTHEV